MFALDLVHSLINGNHFDTKILFFFILKYLLLLCSSLYSDFPNKISSVTNSSSFQCIFALFYKLNQTVCSRIIYIQKKDLNNSQMTSMYFWLFFQKRTFPFCNPSIGKKKNAFYSNSKMSTRFANTQSSTSKKVLMNWWHRILSSFIVFWCVVGLFCKFSNRIFIIIIKVRTFFKLEKIFKI